MSCADVVHLTVDAREEELVGLRDTARAYALRRGAPRPDDVAQAVYEACANVVLHAYRELSRGPIDLRATCDGAGMRFVVEDRGTGLAPHADRPGLGFGLPIIAQLADAFVISGCKDGGTSVLMDFAISSEAGR
jgi:anti-sigma regulatory factor (Ser/Thr protein kinase)